jgi:hypothetical protein
MPVRPHANQLEEIDTMASWRCSCTSAVAALALAAAATPTTQAQDPRINEVRVGQLGADNDEYFELAGTPSTPLTGVYYIVIGDDASNNQGVVEFVLNLLGQSIGASGFFLVVENTFSLSGTPNLVLPALDFEGGYRTHMIVTNFTEQVGADLDTDDDGVLDVFPWTSIIDCVALVGPGTPGVDGDYVYCATQVGPDGEFVPGHIYRCDPDLTWTVGEFDVAGPGATDTPSTVNTSCDFRRTAMTRTAATRSSTTGTRPVPTRGISSARTSPRSTAAPAEIPTPATASSPTARPTATSPNAARRCASSILLAASSTAGTRPARTWRWPTARWRPWSRETS